MITANISENTHTHTNTSRKRAIIFHWVAVLAACPDRTQAHNYAISMRVQCAGYASKMNFDNPQEKTLQNPDQTRRFLAVLINHTLRSI